MMRVHNLTPNPRAYRNDLRGELNRVYNHGRVVFQGREAEGPIMRDWEDIGVELSEPARSKLSALYCRMPREVFHGLVDHEKRFARISRLTEDDRQLSGVDLLQDNRWPFCRDCLLPFTTLLQGDIGGRGCWVNRIEDGADLCECCWLSENYAGDHAKMIEHVLRCDMGDDSRWLRVELRRGRDLDIVVGHLEHSYWRSPGLRELIRLHRVSLTECAEVIVRMVKDLVKRVRRDERERNSRRAMVSKTLHSGTRESVYA
jgi:hypothetical protein